MIRNGLAHVVALTLVGVGLAYGCSSDGDIGGGDPAGTATGNTGASNTGGSGEGGNADGGTTSSGASTATGTGPGGGCVSANTQCTDCIDNDADGWIDGWDTECIGPLDNDEGSFATGIPGDNVDPCKQDCFFDGNSGQGDDGCIWQLKCDPLSPGDPDCPYDPNFMNCPEQSQKCIDFCLGLTPNGCDCFGCCDVTLKDGTSVTILIGLDGCTEETATDPTLCKPCTKVAECENTCETCEYCLGKTELPPECDMGTGGGGGGPTGQCPEGVTPCDPDTICPAGQYCLTGCCTDVPA